MNKHNTSSVMEFLNEFKRLADEVNEINRLTGEVSNFTGYTVGLDLNDGCIKFKIIRMENGENQVMYSATSVDMALGYLHKLTEDASEQMTHVTGLQPEPVVVTKVGALDPSLPVVEMYGRAHFLIPMTLAQVDALITLAQQHYDHHCRISASDTGFIKAWRGTINAGNSIVNASWSEVDTTSKILEMSVYTSPDQKLILQPLKDALYTCMLAARKVTPTWVQKVNVGGAHML